LGDAERQGILTTAEADQLREVETLTARVIAVDHFDPAEVKPHYMKAGHNAQAAETTAQKTDQRSAAAE
jgi:acyl-CoA dehydrogenase